MKKSSKDLEKELKNFDKNWDYKKSHVEYFKEREKIDKQIIDNNKNKQGGFFNACLKLFGLK